MRACSFVCLVFCALLITDQFYRGLNLTRLFLGGFVAVAFWTDNSRWLIRRYRKMFYPNSTHNPNGK